MPEKQKARERKELPTILTAAAMTIILTLWNAFANHDRRNVEAASPSTLAPASVNGKDAKACAAPVSRINFGARCMTVTHTRSS
jgi:hypothetical protein